MSLRSGNNKKKGQKYQNTFTFKHNKGSLLTRKIASTPLDLLCKRCIEILQWKIDYRKYKPLSTVGRCNLCKEKKIYKAYRTICDECAINHLPKKLCSKCGEEVDEYEKPTNSRNNPESGIKKIIPVMEIVKGLKKKYQKTVYRKINKGVKIEYDEEKGIIDRETKEIILPLRNILGKDFEESEDDDDEEEEEKEEKKEEILNSNKNDNETKNKDINKNEENKQEENIKLNNENNNNNIIIEKQIELKQNEEDLKNNSINENK